MKYQREHKYNLNKSEEPLYKEVVFETSKHSRKQDMLKPYNKLKKQETSNVRNWDDLAATMSDLARIPKHAKINQDKVNKHEFYNDPYMYLEDPNQEMREKFDELENRYRRNLTMKHGFLQETMIREHQNRKIQIGN